jgi:succinate dehydrogenase / fumarate reductase cytochrome b subunit
LALLAYLLLHTFSIGSVMFGEKFYMSIHEIYGFVLFRLGLIGVAGAVSYHAFNGIRIILMDFTDWGVKIQRQLWYGVLILAVIATGIAAAINLPWIFDNDPNTMRHSSNTQTVALAKAVR